MLAAAPLLLADASTLIDETTFELEDLTCAWMRPRYASFTYSYDEMGDALLALLVACFGCGVCSIAFDIATISMQVADGGVGHAAPRCCGYPCCCCCCDPHERTMDAAMDAAEGVQLVPTPRRPPLPQRSATGLTRVTEPVPITSDQYSHAAAASDVRTTSTASRSSMSSYPEPLRPLLARRHRACARRPPRSCPKNQTGRISIK